MESPCGVPLIDRAGKFPEGVAIVDDKGEFTYAQLLESSSRAAKAINHLQGRQDLREAPICFLTPPGFDYAVIQWAIWRAGGIAVPLCDRHPIPEIEHVLADAGAKLLVAHPTYIEFLQPLADRFGIELVSTTYFDRVESPSAAALPKVSRDRRAMILYTSGSTGKPKGAVTTHANIEAQIRALVEAWEWRADDRILNVLPLHHVHGIINVLSCALWAGAVCEFQPKFEPEAVWKRFQKGGLTLFMAVPTIYHQLIEFWENSSESKQQSMSAACRDFRLMVSGSAALPLPVLERWRQISGHTLLERYGMTEIGMALSNPLQGVRLPGYVGNPLPSVQLRITGEGGSNVEGGTPGQIEVKGPSIFLEYWRQPEATKEAFCDGWFQTGDIAVLEKGAYRILGRSSVDIIKTGGYKVSALEIENVLLEHPAIRGAAVVGISDVKWGEAVCAAIIFNDTAGISEEELREWAKSRLAHYKVPRQVRFVKSFPSNAMGKVVKTALRELFSDCGEE